MICKKEDCVGCFACYNKCPKNAIEMKEDIYGFIYPTINDEKCIKCGLCQKVCPQLNKTILKFNNPKKVYAMYSKNNEIRKKSTSGGIATLLYKNFLKNGGIVYGVSNITEEEKFQFIRIDNNNIKKTEQLSGSKYTHAYINNVYSMLEKDLKENNEVLFIGTPCQVAGLKTYLNENYKKLLTVDLVCHGVSSQKLLREDFESNGIKLEQLSKINFRDNEGYKLKAYDKNNNIVIDKFARESYYYNAFLKGKILRENCYKCRYAKSERISDITIGDFWGLSKESKIYDDEKKGISLVMTMTEKGEQYIKKIFSEVNVEERSLEEAKKGNAQLNHPLEQNKSYQKFLNNYPKMGYKKTMQELETLKEKIKKNKNLYKLYKKIFKGE